MTSVMRKFAILQIYRFAVIFSFIFLVLFNFSALSEVLTQIINIIAQITVASCIKQVVATVGAGVKRGEGVVDEGRVWGKDVV